MFVTQERAITIPYPLHIRFRLNCLKVNAKGQITSISNKPNIFVLE